MSRDTGDLAVILQLIVSRIISTCGFNEATCYLSLNPDAIPANPGDFFCVVAPTSGAYNEPMFDGGGLNQTTVESGVIVKIHSPVQLDEQHRDATFLTDASLGLIGKMKAVLKHLSGWDPTVGGNEQTRDPLIPAEHIFTRPSRALGGVELVFRCNFDWNLT